MPSEAKPKPKTRKRIRSKSRAARQARSRIRAPEAECEVEQPAIVEQPRAAESANPEADMAATPLLGSQASLRSSQAEPGHSVVNVWFHRFLCLLLIVTWTFLITCYFVKLDKYNLKTKEDANGQNETSTLDAALDFLFPTTCILRETQEIKACNKQQDLQENECLKLKCCFSSFRTTLKCYVPFIDKSTQMLRMFAIGVISMIILGFLPICCCSLCRRRSWANRIWKNFKQNKPKLKTDTETSDSKGRGN